MRLRFDDLNPRIGVGVSVTIQVSEFEYVKPGVMMEIDVPPDATVEETFDQLITYLIDKLNDVEEKLSGRINS